MKIGWDKAILKRLFLMGHPVYQRAWKWNAKKFNYMLIVDITNKFTSVSILVNNYYLYKHSIDLVNHSQQV